MRLGVPRESAALERRVAATPESVKRLKALGFEVAVGRGAGTLAGYPDEAYLEAGAALVDQADAWGSVDVVVKVRPPTPGEADLLREGALLVSLLQPERNPELPARIAARKASAIAFERIPRVTRAQKLDVLSSMGSLAGYRAVVEAAAQLSSSFGPLVTAAGSSPPAKVLVIGAGVAGLAAIGAARALGAEVRAFDTRAAAREQVESLGATFLEVDLAESGEGQGGYARTMSAEFIAAEMALFRAQAREVDVIITTALVPGAKAPVLVPRDVVEALKPGSVIVDLAAEQGGNCELTVPDEVAVHHGVRIVGYTDLTSRVAGVASRFVANNVVNLLAELGGAAAFHVDLEDPVIRPAVVVWQGDVLPPPPRPAEPSPAQRSTPPKTVRPPPADARPKQTKLMSPTRKAWGTTMTGFTATFVVFLLGRFAPGDFLQHFTVFVLACFVGWQVIWSVSASLHTPLMSVTNAISGIIVVGGMLQVSRGVTGASILGAIAVFVAAINIAGGFLVTQRMLRMFRREGRGP
jgi:H+-translocating NAD(P) transhydrogenase subunit alpha